MNRLASTTLALALTAVTGSAIAYQDGYGNGNGYRDNNGSYDNGDSRYDNSRYPGTSRRNDYAQVLRVEPIGRWTGNQYSGSDQRQECWNERTNGYEEGYYRDESGRLYRRDSRGSNNNTGGTLLGVLIGGALGNQVGKGDGRTAATIGGAVIGGAIGNNIARSNDHYDQYQDNSGVVRRCRTVGGYQDSQRVTGYNVTYRYAGQTYHAVTSYNPGRRMRVVVDVRPQDGNVAYNR